MKLAPVLRLLHANFVLAREGVLGIVPVEEAPPAVRFAVRMGRIIERRGAKKADMAARLSRALDRLGPSYIKLGQFLATRADVVGEDVAIELAKLQDQVPPVPDEAARREIELALGAPVDTLFDDLGKCVAAASIAQVYHTRLTDVTGTRDVAVKVLRPGVARRFEKDLESYYVAAHFMEKYVKSAKRLRPVAIVDTLAESVRFEMDFRLEAAAISEMAENSAQDPRFRVPTVEWSRTSRNILTMEWIDGIKMSRVGELRDAGFDLPELGRVVLQSFLRHAMRDGFFHADMHQGNLFVEKDGTLVAVDFGITGRLSRHERGILAQILYGFITRDYRRVAELHFRAGYVPETQDVDLFAQALRAIGEPIRDVTAADISMSRLLAQLFEVTEMFQMATQPQLIMLQKTMVVVEGVARSLDPHLNIWKVSEPVVRDWMTAELGPAGTMRRVQDSAGALVEAVLQAPELAKRVDRLSRDLEHVLEKGVPIAPKSVSGLGRYAAARSALRVAALWVIAISLIFIAYGTLS
ncbi:2-polyprenylphenol 6-hydroxylase [Acuticoccus sp. MNP-M23]|uniref:2-polyprenylphenol 6-hydroxylase n=1 Tax=Acuticoccus sp. MNP-M23 TaxID=3072793 RepID=UPI002814C959|nr:2-polyprenylphenol 6-hydroxylase [Acuticoccus sp. MNP-M23]WMS42743.1 2-polyprenylphenol 6-hydroxylase [Acuticoccus sp. MNP-M23]